MSEEKLQSEVDYLREVNENQKEVIAKYVKEYACKPDIFERAYEEVKQPSMTEEREL